MIKRYLILDTRKTVTCLPCVALAKRGDSAIASRATSHERRAARKGLTLIELVVALTIAFVVMLTTALLVHSGYRSWTETYNKANCEGRLGALNTMTALGAIGRKSNKMDYCIYEVTGDNFEKVLPSIEPEEILTGQAVEFHYWDTGLDADLMNPATTGTAYALFYLDGGQLKVDFGPYDPPGEPGGINASHHRVIPTTTITLAKDVNDVEFSHTTRNMNGDGKGSVRMKLTITDPADGSSKTILAATFMRNVWPQ
jgi:hypothetical protein